MTHMVIMKPLQAGVFNMSWASVSYVGPVGETKVCVCVCVSLPPSLPTLVIVLLRSCYGYPLNIGAHTTLVVTDYLLPIVPQYGFSSAPGVVRVVPYSDFSRIHEHHVVSAPPPHTRTHTLPSTCV